MDDYPKLRSVDILPAEISGKRVLLLRDRLSISKELTLPLEGAKIISLFDGSHSFLDIQATIMRQSGFQLISVDEIKRLAELLDSHFYLENENFKGRKELMEAQFKKESVRRSSHPDHSYEADPERLKAQINRFFLDPEGPGALPEIGSGNGLRGIIEKGHLPSEDEQIGKVAHAIRETIDRSGKRACIIASADLSHIGPQFGEPHPVQTYDLPGIRRDDLEMLRYVEELDRDGFYRFIMKEKDKRNICGLPPIYALLSTIECDRTEMIRYDQAHHPHATVTFVSMAFWG